MMDHYYNNFPPQSTSCSSSCPLEIPPSSSREGGRKLCVICGDYSSGKHYGALTCLGCKQFFQRTVRSGYVYACRFNRDCIIVKEKRNQCRYCRFRRCLENNMKREAVQEERDKRQSTTNRQLMKQQGQFSPLLPLGGPAGTPFTVALLLQAETTMRAKVAQLCPDVIPNMDQSLITRGEIPVFGPQDLYSGMKLELHSIVEWAKQLPGFRDMDMTDQVALLRAHSAEVIALETIRRSIEAQGFLISANGKKICRDGHLKIRRHLFDSLLSPCQRLKPSDPEFLCIKALILFDPDTPGLSDREKDRVGAMRSHIQKLLAESCITPDNKICRISDLLLLLPKVYAISLMVTELMKVHSKWWKNEQVPRLVQDVLLKDQEDVDPSIAIFENEAEAAATSWILAAQAQSQQQQFQPLPPSYICSPNPSDSSSSSASSSHSPSPSYPPNNPMMNNAEDVLFAPLLEDDNNDSMINHFCSDQNGGDITIL